MSQLNSKFIVAILLVIGTLSLQMNEPKYLLSNPNCSSFQLRNQIFEGKIIKLSKSTISERLIKFAIEFLQKNLKTDNIKFFEHLVSHSKFHSKLSKIKIAFSNLNKTKLFIKLILEEMNLNLNSTYFDLMRLRSITSYLHKIDEAKPAFAIHRDTWYANSENQINWWIPLFDVDSKDTFAFYPKFFAKKIKNNSKLFNYDTWNKVGGFQSIGENKNKIFPETKELINKTEELKIDCKAGDILVFSANHLHGTKPNITNETRFSLDFRTLDLEDCKVNSVKNVDNLSKGSILNDMLSANNFLKFNQFL